MHHVDQWNQIYGPPKLSVPPLPSAPEIPNQNLKVDNYLWSLATQLVLSRIRLILFARYRAGQVNQIDVISYRKKT
jgi:hypothetical protein